MIEQQAREASGREERSDAITVAKGTAAESHKHDHFDIAILSSLAPGEDAETARSIGAASRPGTPGGLPSISTWPRRSR